MEKLDALIEGYLSYLINVGRKTPRTVTDVRCTLRRAVAALERARPGVSLWHLGLTDYLHWIEQERLGGRTPPALPSICATSAACWSMPGAAGAPIATYSTDFNCRTLKRATSRYP